MGWSYIISNGPLSLFRLWQGNILKGAKHFVCRNKLVFWSLERIYLYDFALWLFYRYISLCALFCLNQCCLGETIPKFGISKYLRPCNSTSHSSLLGNAWNLICNVWFAQALGDTLSVFFSTFKTACSSFNFFTMKHLMAQLAHFEIEGSKNSHCITCGFLYPTL